MDSIGPAPTGPLPEAPELCDEDVEQLLEGKGGPTAWSEIAELLVRIRMEAAVEPDDLWVRTHVAVAAAAVRKANLVPDPTAGRPSRQLRLGAVAAATTTLIATMGLAAADTLPDPLQAVASQVASLVGVNVPDGHDRGPGLVQLPPPSVPGAGETPSRPEPVAPSHDRQASPDAGSPPAEEGQPDATAFDRFSRRPIIDSGRTAWNPDWLRDIDRFERRDGQFRSLIPSGPPTLRRPDLPWVAPGSGDQQSGGTLDLPEFLERLRPYVEPGSGDPEPTDPAPSWGSPSDGDEAGIFSLPRTWPRWRIPPPPAAETRVPTPTTTTPPPLPRRPRPGERSSTTATPTTTTAPNPTTSAPDRP